MIINRMAEQTSLGTVYYMHETGKVAIANAVGVKYQASAGIKKKEEQFVDYNGKKYADAKEWITKHFGSSGKKCMGKIDITPRPKTDIPKVTVLSFGSI